jgi:hypothetical protein
LFHGIVYTGFGFLKGKMVMNFILFFLAFLGGIALVFKYEKMTAKEKKKNKYVYFSLLALCACLVVFLLLSILV